MRHTILALIALGLAGPALAGDLTPKGYRDRALLRLLADLALRRAEAVQALALRVALDATAERYGVRA